MYEEIVFDRVEAALDLTKTLAQLEIGNGDILVLSRLLTVAETRTLAFPDAISYLRTLDNRFSVTFRDLREPKRDLFVASMDRTDSYDAIAQFVAPYLDSEPVPWENVRFTGHNSFHDMPKNVPARRLSVQQYMTPGHQNTLEDICKNVAEGLSKIVYCEVCDFPVVDLESKDLVSLHMMTGDLPEGELSLPLKLLAPRGCTVQMFKDLLKAHLHAIGQPVPTRELRLMHAEEGRMSKADLKAHTAILPARGTLDGIRGGYVDYTLLAEEMTEYEQRERQLEREDPKPGRRTMMYVSHYFLFTSQEVVTTYGFPFQIVIHEGETLGALKPRLYEYVKNKFTPEEFAKFQSSCS